MGSCTSRVEVEPEKGINPYVVKILLFGPCNTGKTKFRTSIADLSEKIEPTDGFFRKCEIPDFCQRLCGKV